MKMLRVMLLALAFTAVSLSGCGGGGTSSSNGVAQGPVIAELSTDSGAVGSTVVISGKNFSTLPGENIVTFNGTPAVVSSCTPSQIVVTVPQGAKTGVVTLKVGSLTTSSTISFTVVQQMRQMGGAIQGLGPLSLEAKVTTLSVSPRNPAGSGDGFSGAGGITTDGKYLYAIEANSSTIRRVDMTTGAATTLAGSGVAGSTDGVGTAASFTTPHGITTDGANLYVTEYYGSTIRKINIATGTVTTLVGSAGSFGTADGTGSAARFYGPTGITTDGANLYVIDGFGTTIRKVVISTGVVTTIAGSAASGSSFLDGMGTAARFKSAGDITTDGTNLYITDFGTIRKMNLATGAVTTVAGSPGQSGSVDGLGTSARFNSALYLTTDGTNLYVSDIGNDTVRKMVLATGAVTTIAGTAGVMGNVDGVGAAAHFTYPNNITTDGVSLFLFASSDLRRID